MATVFKRRADRNRKGSKWSIAYNDEYGKRVTRTAYADKQLSERYAVKLESEARARRDGTIDVALERVAEHGKRPIAEHVEAYRQHLSSKGNTAVYVSRVVSFITAGVKACGWKTIRDIDGAAVGDYIAALRSDDLGPAAINHRLRALKSLTRWLASNHRLGTDRLSSVKLLKTNGERRHERRALDDSELAALFDAAGQNETVQIPKPYRTVLVVRDAQGQAVRFRDGSRLRVKVLRMGTRTLRIPNRSALYLLAASTGFRSSELRSLAPRSFNLDDEMPTVTVEAAYSKRRRRDVQPIRRDVAEALRPVLAAYAANERLWGDAPDNLAPVIAADLRAAGVDVVDADGRVVDFHALRHTFITRLARSGVTPKVAQTLARHSTITLTMDRYSHVALADTGKALDSLPAFRVAEAVAKATGTDDAVAVDSGDNSSGGAQRIAQRAGCSEGDSVSTHGIIGKVSASDGGGSGGGRKHCKTRGFVAARHALSPHDNEGEESGDRWTRTTDLGFMNPSL